jgi:fibronectin-binding autotransporter adhesin
MRLFNGKSRVAVVVAVVAAAVPAIARAACPASAVVWVGGGTNNWGTPSNWSSGAVPGSATDVCVDGGLHDVTLNINAAVDVASFSVQGAYSKNISQTAGFALRVRGDLTLASTAAAPGTLTTSSTGTQVDGSLNLSAGTFDASTGTVAVAGDVNVAGGTFRGRGGALTVTGNLNVTGTGIWNGSTSATSVGGNLAMSSTSGVASTCNGGATSVTGALTASAGTFNTGNGALTVGTPATPRNLIVNGGAINNSNGYTGAITVTGDVVLSAGSFRSTTTTTTINGDLSLSGGAFFGNGTSGTVHVGGSLNQMGGSYAAGATSTQIDGALGLGGSAVSFNAGIGALQIGTSAAPQDLNVSIGTFTGGAGAITVTRDLIVSGVGVYNGSTTAGTAVARNATFASVAAAASTGGGGTTTVTGTLTVSSGTFNNGAGLLRVGTGAAPQSASVTGGTLNSGSGGVTVTSALQVNGGTFTGGAGPVSVYGDVVVSGATGVYNGSTSAGTTIGGNLLLSSTSPTGSTGGGAPTSIGGAVTLSSGTFSNGNGMMTVGLSMLPQALTLSGGVFYGGAGGVTVTGPLIVSGGSFSGNGAVSVGTSLQVGAGSFTAGAGALAVGSDVIVSGTGVYSGSTSMGTTIVGNMNVSSAATTASTGGGGATVVGGAFSQSSGTFNNGSALLRVGSASSPQSATISGGTLNSGPGGITVTNALQVSGGTFTAGSGAVYIAGDAVVSGAGVFNGSTSAGTTIGGALSVASTSATASTGGGGPLSASAATFSGGTFNAGSGTFQAGTVMLPLTVNGGTFNGQAGAISTVGSLVVSSGGFRLASSTTLVGGDLLLSGGAVTSNGAGALQIAGAISQSGGSFAASGGGVQAAAIVQTGGALTGCTSGGTLHVFGSVAERGGSLNVAGGTILVDGNLGVSSGSVTGVGSGTLHVVGAVSQSGGSFTGGGGAAIQVDLDVSQSDGTWAWGSGALTVNGNLYAAGGTFTGGSGAITVNGHLDVMGGGYTGGSGTLIVAGYLTVTAGSFNGGTGTNKIFGDLGPLSGGTFQPTTLSTWIGGALNRPSTANTFIGGTGILLFAAESGTRTHTTSGASLPNVVFNDGLVTYWKLDGNVADSSGYRDNGSFVGTPTWTGAAGVPSTMAFTDGNALNFDGVANYMKFPSTLNLPDADDPQSIALWAKFPSATAVQGLVSMNAAGSAIELGLGGGNIHVWKSGYVDLVTAPAPTDGAWHQITYTTDGVNDRLYLDGVVTNGLGVAHDSTQPTAALLGATNNTPADLFAGALDEVRIYDRALAAADIAALARGRMPTASIVTHTFADTFTTAVGRDFTIASGTVAGTAPITVGGSWYNYGGLFTNTTPVTLTGSGRVILSGGQSFPGITINGGGTYTLYDRLWAPNKTVTVGSTTGSRLALGAFVAHIGALVDQTTAMNGFSGGTGTLVIDGAADANLTGAAYYGLRVEDPSESGIVAYWKLDEGQGRSVRDVSGSGNGGTISSTGTSWTASSSMTTFDNPAALAFDGVTGSASMGTTGLPGANAAQTISLWAKLSSAASPQAMVALTGPASAVKLGLGGGNVRAWKMAGADLVSAVAPASGAWHHIAYTYDGHSDVLYVDGVAANGAGVGHDAGAPTSAFVGAGGSGTELFNGQLDDVRVYNLALTARQIGQLYKGRYAGTGGVATVTVAGANLSVAAGGSFAIDSGNFYTNNRTVTVSATSPAQINAGTLHVGAATMTTAGGLAVNPMGTLLMDTSGGVLQLGNGATLAVDGTLTASTAVPAAPPIIQRNAATARYAFKVGTFAGSTPVLDITGLAVRDTDGNGLWIDDADTAAATTFTRFDNIVFSRGTGAQYLQIKSNALYLASNGCSFDAAATTGSTTYAVSLTGNGAADGDTRAAFGKTICANNWTVGASDRSCLTVAGGTGLTAKSDDDPEGNGIGNSPASNGAVVQFIRGAESDTAGSIVSFPTPAFDWNTYNYYGTYAAYNDASGTSPIVYVRDAAGSPRYSWTGAAGDTLVGTPRWLTSGTAHLLYLATASGKVYRLVDDGSSLKPDTAWPSNPFDCTCTITTPLTLDSSNIYWGGSRTGTQKLWTLGQSSESQPFGSPLAITPTITSATPSMWISGATAYLFLGVVGNLLAIDITNQAIAASNTNLGTASSWGRIAISTRSTNRILTGDDAGSFWSIDPGNFAGTNKQWRYVVANDSMKSSAYFDYATNTVMFGTEGGKVVALDATGTALNGYPTTPDASTDAIRSAPLYFNGVLAVGTTTGKLFFLDRNNGSTGPALIREYYFGPTEAVSGIAYDASSSRYMVSTSDTSTKDGRIYYVDAIPDPTPLAL